MADPGFLGRLAGFCYRRRRLVVVAWLVGVAALVTVGIRYAAPADNNFTGGRAESQMAQNLVAQHFVGQQGDSLTLAIHADSGLTHPTVRPRVEDLTAHLRQEPDIVSVTGPYQDPRYLSRDGRTAFATIRSRQAAISSSVATDVIAKVRAASGDGVTFAVSGPAVLQVETPYGGPTEGIGVAAAMVVLLISFGSLLAMGLPVLTAILGIGGGLAAVELLGHVLPAPAFSPIVAGLIGLGVGVDYALFILTRYREGLAAGLDPREATVTAISTAGRSVVFAGSTVVIAVLGLFVMRQKLLNATAVAAFATVLMTMVTAVTLLPALLGFAGRNIDRLKLPYLGRTRPGSPMAERWARLVQRRPAAALIAATVVLLALAVPALSMRLSFEDSSDEPHGSSGYTAHRLLAEGFGAGYDAPLVVVAQLPATGSDLRPVADALRDTPGIAAVTPVQVSTDGQAAMFIAFPTTGAQDAATTALVHQLRQTTIPRVAGSSLRVYIGGPNAATIDFADQVSSRLPWLVAVVVGLSLILLLILVRSVTIAVKAAVMTLLSVAAAYGVLTAVVQWGWLGRQLGFPTTMPITTWVPLFMFPILFGLSTDYEVFLISRIREEHDAGAPTRDAVTRGLAHTARVITAAAAIMVTVFLSVLLGAEVGVKQFGLGLAVAVLVDATLVRMVLVPAVMELLGRANWWLPGWLAAILPTAEPTTATRPARPVAPVPEPAE